MTRIVVCEGLLRGRAAELATALAGDGHDVTLVDPFVESDPAAYSWAALGDAFAPDDPGRGDAVVAVGGSVGAAAALAFARRHPGRCSALVLLHPLVLFGARTELADLAAAVRARGLDVVWRRLFGPDAEPPRGHGDEVVAAALEGLGRETLLGGPDDLAAVAAPTLLVASAGDPLHAMEVATAYWRSIPTTRMINEVPGDTPLWDRPLDLAGRIGRFLREVGV